MAQPEHYAGSTNHQGIIFIFISDHSWKQSDHSWK